MDHLKTEFIEKWEFRENNIVVSYGSRRRTRDMTKKLVSANIDKNIRYNIDHQNVCVDCYLVLST